MPSDIVVSTVATGVAQRLTLHAPTGLWDGLFDRIQVWRSRQGEAGPYEEVTGPAWSAAFFMFPSRPYAVAGKVLSLKVQERIDVDVTFSGTDPIAAAATATQIQTQSNGLLLSYVSASNIVVQTTNTGAGAVLRIVSSDAAGIFGLSSEEPEAVTFGQDARIALVSAQEVYTFTDPNGSASFYYRVRFSNSLTNETSEFLQSISGSPITSVPIAETIIGTIDLFDLTGKANRDVRVLIQNGFNGALVASGGVVTGGPIEQRTDENGHAEFSLVRGTKITVALAGTPLARTITVPSDPALTTFNLLDPSLADADVFTVQVPEYDYAERRSV